MLAVGCDPVRLAPVPPSQITARRANLDDLPVLRGLWQLGRLPTHELDKRLTEFHVAARPDGVITGTLGFMVSGQHALIHSGAFASLAQEAEGLPVLWEHLLTLARSQSVVRLWLHGPVADHWREAGFVSATGADLKKLPAGFGPTEREWHTLALRDEAAVAAAVEREFATLHVAQAEETERLRRQATFWKLLAWLIALVFFIGAGWLLAVLFRSTPRRERRP